MTMLGIKTAYLAMYQFLDDLALRERIEELLVMMGAMSFLADGDTADSGMWYDWEQAVARIDQASPEGLSIAEAHAAMRSFLETYNARGPSEDISEILTRITSLASGEPGDRPLWNNWLNAVSAAQKNEVDAALRLTRLT